jgi:hypothetical protein
MKPPKTIAQYIRFCRQVAEAEGYTIILYNGQFSYYNEPADECINLYFHNLTRMFPNLGDYEAEAKWQEIAGLRNAEAIDAGTCGVRINRDMEGGDRAAWVRRVMINSLLSRVE